MIWWQEGGREEIKVCKSHTSSLQTPLTRGLAAVRGRECWQLRQARPGVPACGRLWHICCFLFLLAELNPCRKCTGGSAQMISYCLLCKADHSPSSFVVFLPASHHISLHGQACPPVKWKNNLPFYCALKC